jgi:Domain of unknown function (DUF4429)/Protein of unknown function (DUF2510)/Short C-terminal domain
MSTPAGWYADTAVPGQQRYWDGTAWTEHIAPLSVPAPPPQPDGPTPASLAVPDDEADPASPGPMATDGSLLVKGHTGQISFDGTWVTIHRKGGLARMSVGKGEKRLPVSSITAVQWKPAGAMVNGFIQFTVPGDNESRSRMGSQTTDAARDENSVVFAKKQMPDFEVLRASIEKAIATPATAVSAAAPPDALEQLRKLAELRDAGIVSPAEFDAKKTEILSRM